MECSFAKIAMMMGAGLFKLQGVQGMKLEKGSVLLKTYLVMIIGKIIRNLHQ
jgi:hypothetical protein